MVVDRFICAHKSKLVELADINFCVCGIFLVSRAVLAGIKSALVKLGETVFHPIPHQPPIKDLCSYVTNHLRKPLLEPTPTSNEPFLMLLMQSSRLIVYRKTND